MSDSLIDRLFAAAVRLKPGPERSAYLTAAAGDNFSLLEAVEKLLALHDDAGSFLELNAFERDPSLLPFAAYRTEQEQFSEFDFIRTTAEGDSLGSLGRYTLRHPLGVGGNAVVLLAEDELLQREVAIKLLSPTRYSSELQRKNLLREARAAAAVSDEHVVQVFDIGEHEGTPYLVMEYFPGGSLRSHLERHGPLCWQDCRTILLQVTAALQAAHGKGILHCDLKPGNVLVERFPDRVKLSDFGLALSLDSSSGFDLARGTYQFTAPEQLTGSPPSAKADLFGLGCLGVALLTGSSPFAGWPSGERPSLNGTELAMLLKPIDRGNAALKELLFQLLSNDPTERPKNATVVREALERL